MSPLTLPTETELNLVLVAKYETHLNANGGLQRRLSSLRALVAAAALIFTYDVGSVFLFR